MINPLAPVLLYIQPACQVGLPVLLTGAPIKSMGVLHVERLSELAR